MSHGPNDYSFSPGFVLVIFHCCSFVFSSPGLRPENRPSLYGITEGLVLTKVSGDHPVPPPCESRVTGEGHTGSHSGGFGISLEQETPQPPWDACSSAPSPSE